MYSSAREAYDRGARTSASNRGLEAAALSRAAHLLETCKLDWSAPGSRERLDQALRNNQRLWTLFQTELMRPDHGLDVQVRANLLKLSGFVDRRTFEIRSAPEPGKLQALIDINRNLAAGLSEAPG